MDENVINGANELKLGPSDIFCPWFRMIKRACYLPSAGTCTRKAESSSPWAGSRLQICHSAGFRARKLDRVSLRKLFRWTDESARTKAMEILLVC